MNGTNDKELAGYAERLKSISRDYQQNQQAVKGLIRDVRGETFPPMNLL